jgi:D-3-phosphoglycerate dehydrogenase
MDSIGSKILQENNFEICNINISELQEVPNILPDFDVLVVRSATKVNANLLKNCGITSNQNSKLRLIARAGVGLDNIDLSLAEEKKISVINTPMANTRSVAEMFLLYQDVYIYQIEILL